MGRKLGQSVGISLLLFEIFFNVAPRLFSLSLHLSIRIRWGIWGLNTASTAAHGVFCIGLLYFAAEA